MKKFILSVILVICFALTLVFYLYYSNNLSGKPAQLIKIPFNHNQLDEKNISKFPLRIDPILLTPERNPYRFYLSIGFTPKVGRASLTNSSYSYQLALTDKNQEVLLETIHTESTRNRLGGNPELLIDTINLGNVSVPIKDFYDLKLIIDNKNTEIKFIQIDLREDAQPANKRVVWLLAMLITISLINLLRVTSASFGENKLSSFTKAREDKRQNS